LNRNVGVPLGFGFLSAFFFCAIVYYLLQVSHSAENSVAEVAVAHDTFKVLIDLESGMRGYLIAGEEVFLDPYKRGGERFAEGIADLKRQLGDDPLQMRRIEQIEALQKNWQDYAELGIERRREGLPIINYVRSERGRTLNDQMREQFNALIAAEETKRASASDSAETIST